MMMWLCRLSEFGMTGESLAMVNEAERAVLLELTII